MNKTKPALVLLSGGLDSLVNLAEATAVGYDVTALFIDYGQKAADKELKAAGKQSDFYGCRLITVSLPWYRGLLPPGLRGELTDNPAHLISAEGDTYVWAPNRNGLLLAAAAAYAEYLETNLILTGFNAEEAETFPDNSADFIAAYNESLRYSTSNGVMADSFTAEMDKKRIVARAIELGAPLNMVYSCYGGGEALCGSCNSCLRLLRALDNNDVPGEKRPLFSE